MGLSPVSHQQQDDSLAPTEDSGFDRPASSEPDQATSAELIPDPPIRPLDLAPSPSVHPSHAPSPSASDEPVGDALPQSLDKPWPSDLTPAIDRPQPSPAEPVRTTTGAPTDQPMPMRFNTLSVAQLEDPHAPALPPVRPLGQPSPPAECAISAPAATALENLPGTTDRPSESLPAAPTHLLILDTETTALTPDDGQCIEVGAVLFHVPLRAVLTQVSFLLPCDSNPAEVVNGIPAEVTRLPQPWEPALACFEAMLSQADALLAHNASFDRQWFGRGLLPALDKPWICSMDDIRWPASLGLRSTPSVQSLALAYGVPVWAAHRALTDCTYLVQVFQRCSSLESLLSAALESRCLMRADVSYDNRHLAREAGFRWDNPVPKAWTRRLSAREARDLPFPVHPVTRDGMLRS